MKRKSSSRLLKSVWLIGAVVLFSSPYSMASLGDGEISTPEVVTPQENNSSFFEEDSDEIIDVPVLLAGTTMYTREVNTDWKDFKDCHKIEEQVKKSTKNGECFLKLFAVESGCRVKKSQSAGNAGNNYASYGLCSMEKPPRGRPKVCSKWDLVSQIQCCDKVMSQFSKKGSYFGPVRRNSVPKCS